MINEINSLQKMTCSLDYPSFFREPTWAETLTGTLGSGCRVAWRGHGCSGWGSRCTGSVDTLGRTPVGCSLSGFYCSWPRRAPGWAWPPPAPRSRGRTPAGGSGTRPGRLWSRRSRWGRLRRRLLRGEGKASSCPAGLLRCSEVTV